MSPRLLIKSDSATDKRSHWPKNKLWWKIIFAILVAGVAIVGIASWYAGQIARRHLVKAIETHYHSKVELKGFTVVVFPHVVISGEGLVLRKDLAQDTPPFISIAKFTADAGILDLLRRKKRIRHVMLEGLEIHIVHSDRPSQPEEKQNTKVPDFVIAEVQADNTKLVIHPRDPAKDPREWQIHQLSLRSAGTGDSMHYQATLTNPTPPGRIDSTGHFGPLNVDDPGKSPLKGEYQFRNADLGHFKGIGGILSSDGDFSGVLERIDAKGKCDVLDFSVGDGHKVHLTTEFTVVVDGTDGDTYLHEVRAAFLHTRLLARGKVEGSEGQKGKTISLKVDSEQARVEDLVALVVAGEPPLSGAAELHTKFELPPGQAEVLQRLQLDGDFGLEQTRFARNSIQQKVAKLSARSQGNKSEYIVAGDTASNFAGHFTLRNGVAHFSNLSFDVPGASVNLAGTYDLDQEALNFQGHLHMQASLSEMTSGIKSFFAKLAQPFFSGKKGEGKTDIPIKISGTRAEPKFGLDLGKVLNKD
jgi:hypothetical protein